MITTDDLLEVMRRHIGRDSAVHMGILAAECAQLVKSPVSERSVRKVVERLREEGHHICATPGDGYYVAATDAELLQTIEFLRSRAMTSLKQLAAMKQISMPELIGQLNLEL